MNFYDLFNCSFQKLINSLNDCSQPESDAQYLAITFPIIVIKSFALPSDATPTQAVSIKSINLFILSFCGTFMDGLTKSLAKELGPSNIRVNSIAPGMIMTDMLKGVNQDELNALAATIPLGYIGEPEEIAKVILFLASTKASYVNDSIIRVDGGKFNG